MDPFALGILLTTIGLGLAFWGKKRKFDRTNLSGVERFNSFSGKLISTTIDSLLHVIGIGMLFVGLFILAFG